MAILKRWKTMYKEGVLLNSFYHDLTLSRIKISPFYLVKEELDVHTKQNITTKLSPCEIVMLKPDDLRIIAAKSERDYSEEQMLAMLKKNCYCMGIKYNDEIVAYGWYELKRLTSPLLTFPLERNEAYLSSARTFKKYRGNNLAPYLRYQMYEHLKKLGCITLYSISDFSNVPSIRFKRKLGAKKIKLYLFIRVTKHFRKLWLLRTYRDKRL